MKLGLVREMETAPGIKIDNGRAFNKSNVLKTCPMRRIEFMLQNFLRFARRQEQVAVHPGEIAVDLLLSRDSLDFVNCRRMTLGSQLCSVSTMKPFEFTVSIVQCGDQMGRGTLRYAATDWSIIKN